MLTVPKKAHLKVAHCTQSWRALPAVCVLALSLCGWPSQIFAQNTATPTAPTEQALSNNEPAEQGEEPPNSTKGEPAKPETKEVPLYESREARNMHLLAKVVDQDAVVWLTAKGVDFLALYEEELTGDAVGAVLLLNATGQHSSWPKSSERIRLSLPEFGWSTLSTELPDPRTPAPPEREWFPPANSTTTPGTTGQDAPQQEDSQATTETPSQLEEPEANAADPEENANKADQQASTPTATEEPSTKEAVPPEVMSLARVEAAISYLHQQGQFNVVMMGEGIGALRAACFINSLPALESSTQARLIRALILVNASNRPPTGSERLYDCLKNAEIPMLDVFFDIDKQDKVEARKRLKHAKRNNLKTYQQIALPEMSYNTLQGENRLSRRIRGFLEVHARGVKVDNAIINK